MEALTSKSLESIFLEVVGKPTLLKMNYVRGNHALYINKTLRKAIMRWCQLKSKYLNTKTQKNFGFLKNKITCSKLYQKKRKKYHEAFDIKKITDNKNFRRATEPFLFERHISTTQISIKEKQRVFTDDLKLSSEFSNFFDNAVKSLNIFPNEFYLTEATGLSDPVEIAIIKVQNYPSILYCLLCLMSLLKRSL